MAACPLCGSEHVHVLHQHVEDFEYGLPVVSEFTKCDRCALVFLSPPPTREQLAASYPTDYRPHAAAERTRNRKTLLSRLKDMQSAMLIGKMKRWLPPVTASILELGCGGGHFLKALQRQGYENLTGIDQNSDLASVFEGSGIRYVAADLERGIPLNTTFDTVVMNYSLEHFLQPERVLNDCARILKPGGSVLILTPNSASLSHSVFGKYWSGLHAPRHVHVFARPNVEVLSKRTGLLIKDCRFLNDPASWALSLQNRIVSIGSPSKSSAGTKWYTLLALPFMTPFALLENALGCGSSLIVCLQKAPSAKPLT